MTKQEKKEAADRYEAAYKENPEDAIEKLSLDFETDDAAEILELLKFRTPAASASKKETAKGGHPNYSWFDEFNVRVQKRTVRNHFTNSTASIITGWAFENKKVPKLIEPALAKELNSYADGWSPENPGAYLVLQNSKKPGDFLSYEDWAKEQGRDLKTDLNILLSKN